MSGDEFVYLMPGSWFELKNINHDKTYPFDINALKNEILNQVNSRSEKLSFIDLTFGAMYRKNTVEDIIFYLDNEKFNTIAKLLQNEKRHPIITFHGTSLTAVNSILASGYIVPGSRDKKKSDVIVSKKHGSAYGIGIYSSPFFDKAMNYTKPIDTKYVYILINMVFLGVMKMIPPGGSYTDFKPPVNGVYADGSNTRVVYGLEQLVSANSERIVPVAVMKIKIE
ncbi:hypothetical protein QJ857_gp0121 [Tupanvirus soda lake]|uniref:PARP catalytic domain-containing protein n=2 Tax=Tupanvirus TaxID=2094720 RepID=A0A6N1P267_9VIRU|nr:hypothetical protein QJ857_gp0121 [Tupanvirus soda lake]QKU35902.1 hypothetical protein [Tupanvirus soda lake]